MLASIHHHIAASCAVCAQEHADDTHNLPTASTLPEGFPHPLPLSGAAATPDPLSSPPRGEGHPSGHPYMVILHSDLDKACSDRFVFRL
jgi:hypothetical protein